MSNHWRFVRLGGAILTGLLALIVIYLTSLRSYLLFHSLIEVFTIVVAAGIFMISWNARAYINNNYLLFIGIASVFVGFLDLLHTLAYEGMAVFPGDTANLATQLWVAGRYVQSLSWLLAPLFLTRRLRVTLEIAVYVLVAGLLILAIFVWHVFPAAYVPGVGLTLFKKVSEYLVAAVFVAAIALLLHERQQFDERVLRLVVISLTLTIAAEIAFTSYVSVYGEANLIGHLLRFAAFYMLYKAIIETGLVRPYAILLRDLKRSEEQLREHAEALQAQNEELERTEGELRERGVALAAHNEELDAYAHTVAHDLKNPLTVIISTGDVINEVKNLRARERREFIRQIKTTAFEMNGIVDSLLLLSEVRKAEAPKKPINMAEVVEHVQRRLDYMIGEYHGRLISPMSWPIAVGYAPWIEEVWANYITNALKYGGPTPRVELGAAPQPDGMIRFWVRDHGPGISPEAQDALFTPFTQLRKARQGGHGLGLSIVLRIVEKLGGQVGVESEPGGGSLFYFTLPAAPTEATADNRELAEAAS